MAETMSMEEVRKHVRVYMIVFGSLAVLTVVTVAVGYIHLPIYQALVVALTIAIIKGSLVAMYFMHLISEKKVIYVTLALTVAFLLFMFALVISAYHGQEGSHIVS